MLRVGLHERESLAAVSGIPWTEQEACPRNDEPAFVNDVEKLGGMDAGS